MIGMDLAGTVDTPLVPAIPDQPPGGGGGAFGRPALEVVVALLWMKAAAATAVATPLRSANSASSCSSLMLSANIVRVVFELGGGKCWSEMLTQKQSLTMSCKWCSLVSCCHISGLMLSHLQSYVVTSPVLCQVKYGNQQILQHTIGDCLQPNLSTDFAQQQQWRLLWR